MNVLSSQTQDSYNWSGPDPRTVLRILDHMSVSSISVADGKFREN